MTGPPTETVPLPPSEPPRSLLDGIRHWTTSTPMRALVDAFGGKIPDMETGDLLRWLDGFSAEHWDFRRGAERSAAVQWEPPPEVGTIIMQAAWALGMVDPAAPSRADYDHLLVLGGLTPSCRQRMAYAASLIADGLQVGEVAALGSFRPCIPIELVQLAATDARFEVDALDFGVREAFGLDRPLQRHSSGNPPEWQAWRHDTYRTQEQRPIHVLAAPSSDPGRRAITADTYEFWADRLRIVPGASVLIVTTPLYVPFQHCDAIRILGRHAGCSVETIGFDRTRIPVGLRTERGDPGRHLQEVRSAIRSMRNLHDATSSPAAS